MIRVGLVIVAMLLSVGSAQAQMRPIEIPRAPSMPSMPAPMPSVPQAPSLGAPSVQVVPPPPPVEAVETHPHAPEVCDCYRTVYDQQGRPSRVFSGRSHQCCP